MSGAYLHQPQSIFQHTMSGHQGTAGPPERGPVAEDAPGTANDHALEHTMLPAARSGHVHRREAVGIFQARSSSEEEAGNT